MDEAIDRLVTFVRSNHPDKETLQRFKLNLARELHLKEVPTDIEILLNSDDNMFEELRHLLLTKPVRTLSGVSPIAIMTRPFPCPHGACRMCPSLTEKGMSQSYTGKEPSARRALRNEYDVYRIVWNRLEQYVVTGHSFDKIELIIQGGTFLSFPKDYQEEVITEAFRALNDFSRLFFKQDVFDLQAFKEFFELPGKVGDPERITSIWAKIAKNRQDKTANLEEEQDYNDLHSKIKCVGLTIETRPDWGLAVHADQMLRFGATRVELGVQSVYDDVLNAINRGHTVAQTKQSIKELKDAGFKLNFHYMPGLPGIKDTLQDLQGLKSLFDDPDFRPDMLKLYPCIVVKDSILYDDFKAGIFHPITTAQAADLLARFKAFIPEYCRVMRVQRDIPSDMIEGGVNMTNLREAVERKAIELGIRCRCIRCREIKDVKIQDPQFNILEYDSSGGKEFFISLDDSDKLIGFARLRFPAAPNREEITKDSAIIRELHVYGHSVPLGDKHGDASQHRGFGKLLMEKAEGIARQNGKIKMVIISGVGVRGYYRKIGYQRQGPYMVKQL